MSDWLEEHKPKKSTAMDSERIRSSRKVFIYVSTGRTCTGSGLLQLDMTSWGKNGNANNGQVAGSAYIPTRVLMFSSGGADCHPKEHRG